LPTLSTILFLISLVSFSFVSIIFLSRLFSPTHIRLKHRSSPLIERDSVELGFVQYWPAGFALAGVSFGCFAVAEGRVKGRWAMAVYICWWITALWMGITGFFILGAYMSHSTVLVRSKTSPGRGLPLIAVLGGVTGGATVVLAGAVMCLPGSGAFLEKQKIISDGMAAPVVIFCYCGIGGLLLLAVLTYAVVMHELLLVTGWPPPELTGVMFYLVGPLGQSAGALLILGEVVGNGHYLGDLDNRTGGRKTGGLPIATTVSVFFGMLLFGMGGFFLILAIVCLVYRAYRRELEWSCTWNGSVFPLGTLAFSSLWLSYELESGFFRILTLVLVIICFGLFVLLLGFNLKMAVRSRVFRVEDE
ncbi:voltage-dependent anion channel, partial [Podospora fimiseda]